MEEYAIFIDRKAQCYKDDSVPKFGLQKSVQARAKPLLFCVRVCVFGEYWQAHFKMHMEMQNAKHNLNNIEEEQSCRTNTTKYQDL